MRRKTTRRLLRIISAIPGLYPALAFLCARRARIEGRSMHPALLPGERVLFDRLAYRRDRPAVGDVVLVQHPERDMRIVKRIAEAPEGRTLAPGEYWVAGDNADGSTDSRGFGPVQGRHLLARGWLVYWPSANWRNLR